MNTPSNESSFESDSIPLGSMPGSPSPGPTSAFRTMSSADFPAWVETQGKAEAEAEELSASVTDPSSELGISAGFAPYPYTSAEPVTMLIPAESVPLTPKEMNLLLWKIDLRLIPFLTLVYSALFADRTLIGLASLYGMIKDLDSDGPKFFTAVSLFYILYGACEPGTNACVKYFRPSIWLPLTTILAGVCMLAHGMLTNYRGLLAARLCLGVAEGAF